MSEYHVEIDGIVHVWEDAVDAIMNPYSTRCGLVWYGRFAENRPDRLYGRKSTRAVTCENCRGTTR